MSELAQKPDRLQVLEELNRILASSSFKNKERWALVLKYLVEQALAGEKVTEIAIGRRFYGDQYDPKADSAVRVDMSRIRSELGQYYANEGRTNPLRIELPPKTYVTTFKVSQPVRIPGEPSGPAPEGPIVVTRTPRRPWWRNQLFVAAAIFIVGAVVVSLLWLANDCSGSFAITSPARNEEVVHKQTVTGKRDPKRWYSRCKDYLVVEAVDWNQWYIAGSLPDSPNWNLTATFGDPATLPGTRFNVFVLSTTQDLRPGASPQIKGGQSASVSVTRKKL